MTILLQGEESEEQTSKHTCTEQQAAFVYEQNSESRCEHIDCGGAATRKGGAKEFNVVVRFLERCVAVKDKALVSFPMDHLSWCIMSREAYSI